MTKNNWQYPWRRRRPAAIGLISLLWWLTTIRVAGAGSSTFYHPYQYDLTAPQFTPGTKLHDSLHMSVFSNTCVDGRLLQVEYASRAAQWSTPLWIITVNDDCSILVTSSSSSKSHLQERLVVGAPDVVVGLSGLLPDGLALWRVVQAAWWNTAATLGSTVSGGGISSVTGGPWQWAEWIKGAHRQAGGVRPHGCTLLVAGIMTTPGPRLWIQVLDPSGGARSVDTARNLARVEYVGGGGAKSSSSIDQSLAWTETELTLLRQELTTAVAAAGKANPGRMGPVVAAALQKLRDHAARRGFNDNLKFEVVVISTQHGVYKLHPRQIRQLLGTSAATVGP
jgi:hypothetical protein